MGIPMRKQHINEEKYEKEAGRNLVTLGAPIILALLLFTISIIHQINLETALPSEGWSRSVSLNAFAADSEMFIAEGKENHVVYIPGENGLEKLTISPDLTVNKEKTDIKTESDFWAGGDTIVYINDDGNVVKKSGEEETVLVKNADGLAANENSAVIWNEAGIFQASSPEWSFQKAGEAKGPIKWVIPDSTSLAFTAVIEEGQSLEAHYFPVQGASSLITTLQTGAMERVTAMDILYEEDKMHVVYTISSSKQGSRSSRLYYGEGTPGESLDRQDISNLYITYENSSERIMNPEYPSISLDGGKPTILFSTRATISPKEEALSIIKAVPENNGWSGKRVSTTDKLSVKAEMADDQTIIWFDNELDGTYTMMAASSKPEVVEATKKVTGADLAAGFYNAIWSLATGLIIIFNIFIWVIPAAVFFVVMSIFDIRKIEMKTPWVLYTMIGLYAAAQFFLFAIAFKGGFYTLAPDYLTFGGSRYILPVLINLAAFGIWRAGRDWDWPILKDNFYFISINTIIMFFLIGPYLL
ncbi:hypothetical protein [Bacillus marinisedimentorum]|uniref:hypothetical protein n=1 Tax=Bacillus marinisedimentorum TaxID=1821260 RepID=UPI0008724ED3|nr:hypothetical protein [Bacillus marinisedimentorum]